MIRNLLRRIPLVVKLRNGARSVVARLRNMRQGLSHQVLTAALIVTYFVVITPIGVVRRVLLGRSLVDRATNFERGWRPIRQSSADKQIYLSDY